MKWLRNFINWLGFNMESHEAIKLEETMAGYLKNRLGTAFQVSPRHNGERMISIKPFSFKIELGAGEQTVMNPAIQKDLDDLVVKKAMEAAMMQLVDQLETIEKSYKELTDDK